MGSDAMRVLTTEGLRLLVVEDENDRSVIGEHHNAIRGAKEGRVAALKPFVGRTISARVPRDDEPRPDDEPQARDDGPQPDDELQQFELEADLKRIKRWYAQNELDYEDIYEQ